MGVDCTTYLIYGVKLPYDIVNEYAIWENNDRFLPYIEGHRNCEFRLIIDGVSGDYCVFGKVLGRIEDVDNKFYEVDLNKVPEERLLLEIKDLFPNYNIIKDTIKIFMFNHYS